MCCDGLCTGKFFFFSTGETLPFIDELLGYTWSLCSFLHGGNMSMYQNKILSRVGTLPSTKNRSILFIGNEELYWG
jgi:hypothetical protein